MRFVLTVIVLLIPAVLAPGCATQNQAALAEKQAAAESEDDATCREKSGENEAAYNACRRALAEERAQQAEVQEQRRRDFDRVLGAGTDGLSNY